ncbi:hypothetical protein GRI38_08205 [Altererythrobacter aurantiacus]|uniref:Uncharacterized protein n=1 Tax=Parapontixanthobacter aurantiacus TaxID=1463599 RepID=A0A844ZDR0_9SPHN|nr:hypothetical protein [Parapontixanthobacter aurantiacus]MXO86015.1 hypothetical protein [Parapontixanthobacter aurantiacus]
MSCTLLPSLMGLIGACAPLPQSSMPLVAAVDETEVVGLIDDDREIREYVLRSSSGMEMRFLNYGGVITSLFPILLFLKTSFVSSASNRSRQRKLPLHVFSGLLPYR